MHDKLRRAYSALPHWLKTKCRKGEALRSADSFMECYYRLLSRAKYAPMIEIAETSQWEIWMVLPGLDAPSEDLFRFECFTSRNEGEYGVVVERSDVITFQDLLGESGRSLELVWWTLKAGVPS
ncbi:hypothetical protein [Myxococcus xanthus]|nr:hypothetical protein [Myxococcus xanthus]